MKQATLPHSDIKDGSMLNRWDYSGLAEACYSDHKQESYKKAAEFLGDSCEDWGCGTGWARMYFKRYRGIEGSPSVFVKPEDVVDLVHYTSRTDNILMRQVLEYNTEWRQILENVKASFRKKFCLIMLTPEVKKTRVGRYHKVYHNQQVVPGQMNPELYFNRQDIRDMFPPEQYRLREESVKTSQEYGTDWILYVEKV